MSLSSWSRWCPRISLSIAVALLSGPVWAQQSAGESLTNPVFFDNLSPLQQKAALANQAMYEQLIAQGCADDAQGPTTGCDGADFNVFAAVRPLVHNANIVTDDGSTEYALNISEEDLALTLPWTSGEELAAQDSATRTFANSQLTSLGSRIAALRLGARGPRVAALYEAPGDLLASTEPAIAAAESIASRWGVYLDGSYGSGDKDDTTFAGGFEDAFDFDSTEVTGGLDYRLTDSAVIGMLAGYTDKSVDFDSGVSEAGGNLDSDGVSLIGYGLLEIDRYFLTGSLGGQWLSHDLERRVIVPSFNPLVPSVDTTAAGNTDSTTFLASIGAGVDFTWGGFTLEPSLGAEYQDISVDAFVESNGAGYDLAYAKQDFDSLDAAFSVKLQYVWTPSFGVLVPFLRAELHHQFEDDPRLIRARYVGVSNAPEFEIPTDQADDAFGILAAGVSLVLPNGWQGFLQFQDTVSLKYFSEQVWTGGVRFEF